MQSTPSHACLTPSTHRSRHTPLNTVKAVILGQDPYHNYNQAHGLCFSVRPPTPAPPSLKNIYAALKKQYPDFEAPPKNGGLLTPWADRGVLLLNTCLTVRAHEANSHSQKGWERFTQKVIDTVNRVRTNGVVFLAWGTPAQQRCRSVNAQRHLVLKSVHPSPLSAHKGFVSHCPFFLLEWDERVLCPVTNDQSVVKQILMSLASFPLHISLALIRHVFFPLRESRVSCGVCLEGDSYQTLIIKESSEGNITNSYLTVLTLQTMYPLT